MPMHPNSNKTILLFFGKSLVLYFLLLLIIRITPLKEHFVLQMNHLLNSIYSDILPKTKVFFHTANNTKRSFVIDRAVLPCPPLSHFGEFDTQTIFVNTSHFLKQLENRNNDPNSKLVIQNYKSRLSIWDIVWMPIILVFSLSVCFPDSMKRRLKLIVGTSLTILIIGLIRCYCILLLELLNAPVLEPLILNNFFKNCIQFIAGLQGIEFIYISSFVVWVISVLILTPFINNRLIWNINPPKKILHHA